MLAELRKHVPATVGTMQAAFEDLRPGERYGLVYAAAALHWTNPEGRWSRIAALLETVACSPRSAVRSGRPIRPWTKPPRTPLGEHPPRSGRMTSAHAL
jgi:hypothetical protein